MQQARTLGELPYLSFKPADREAMEPDGWPLVLFLHGAGERGRDLDAVRRHGIPRIADRDPTLRVVAVSPQCPAGRWWVQLTDALHALIDDVVAREPIDPARIYLTGMSMGGYGVWKLAAEDPGRFAAVVPVCGGGDPAWAPRLSDLPIWAFHGDADPVVPVEETTRMVAALRALGADPKMTIYPGVGHDSWTRTYDDPALYEWLLAQRRR